MNRLGPIAALAPICGLLAACASTGAATLPPAPGTAAGPGERPPLRVDSADAEQEALYSAAMSRAGLTVRVNSNGCTKKEDFRIMVLDGYPAPTVIIKRMKPDLCRSFAAGGTDMTFSYAELGVAPSSQISLANPLASDPTPGR